MAITLKCPQCQAAFTARTGDVNRATKRGAPKYCSKACSGLARRIYRDPVEKKKLKAAYDREYRNRNHVVIKAKKAARYRVNCDREKEREIRKKRMPRHVEYCRRPEYKAYKHEYDKRRNESEFGEFAEAWRLLQELEKEIRSQSTAYERRVANGYYIRSAQKRRRDLCQMRKLLNLTPAT